MDVHLSIIVASVGRPSLQAALRSATNQMLPGDELILVFDDSGDFGDTAHNRGLSSATGTHIVCLDDDDEFAPGALDSIRTFARAHPEKIGIFRVSYGPGGIYWRADERLNLMQTQTGMYVVPNIPMKVGRFGRPPGQGTEHIGDYRYIVESVALQGQPVWCEAITQEIRPEKNPLKRLRYDLQLGVRVRRCLGLPILEPPRARRGYPEAEAWARDLLSSVGLDPGLATFVEPMQ